MYNGPDTTALAWRRPGNLRVVVEVVPVVPGADPVVVRDGVVGLVVGVRGDVVELPGLGVLAGGFGVEGSGGLTVEGREHRKKEMYPARCGRRDNLFIRVCLSRIYFSRKLKREHCFCTAILSQIVTWYKKDDVTKKNRLSHVTSCLEFVTKKACLFAIQIFRFYMFIMNRESES